MELKIWMQEMMHVELNVCDPRRYRVEAFRDDLDNTVCRPSVSISVTCPHDPGSRAEAKAALQKLIDDIDLSWAEYDAKRARYAACAERLREQLECRTVEHRIDVLEAGLAAVPPDFQSMHSTDDDAVS